MNKQRLSVTIDPALVRAADQAVARGQARNLSAWVSEALQMKADHDRRLSALAALVAEYEAEHGEITADEMRAAARRARARAVIVRPAPRRLPARRLPARRKAARR